jgi:hypothetical protein
MKTIAYTPAPEATIRRNVKYIAVLRTNKATRWENMPFGEEGCPEGRWVCAHNCENKANAEAKAQALKWHLANGFQKAIGYHHCYNVKAADLEVVILRVER